MSKTPLKTWRHLVSEYLFAACCGLWFGTTVVQLYAQFAEVYTRTGTVLGIIVGLLVFIGVPTDSQSYGLTDDKP
jgi:uncharacterized membrane protein